VWICLNQCVCSQDSQAVHSGLYGSSRWISRPVRVPQLASPPPSPPHHLVHIHFEGGERIIKQGKGEHCPALVRVAIIRLVFHSFSVHVHVPDRRSQPLGGAH